MGGGRELPPHTHSWTNRNYNEVHSGEKMREEGFELYYSEITMPKKRLRSSSWLNPNFNRCISPSPSATAVRAQSVGVPLIDGRGRDPSFHPCALPLLSLSSILHSFIP